MGSAGASAFNQAFFDYYQFLGVAAEAPSAEIRDAIARWRELNDRDRIYPDKMRDVERREARVAQAEKLLLDPERRRAFDEEFNRHAAQRDTGLLWLDPEFVYDGDDMEPAQTVPGLAWKLDQDWPRAIATIKSGAVEQVLRFVAPRRPASIRPRYAALETEIARLRTTLGERHPQQMLESVIVLCDSRVAPAQGQITGQPLDGATLATITVRPDRAQTTTFSLQRAPQSRGCLFGHVWIAEPWATISSPAPATVLIDGERRSAVAFELMNDATLTVTLSMAAEGLLKLSRPQTHPLHIAFELQPATAHHRLTQCALPVDITPIPPRAYFTPTLVKAPLARRGQRVTTGTAQLMNGGEAPLNARRAPNADHDLVVSDALDGAGGAVQVTVDTSRQPYGKTYSKSIVYLADGDVPSLALQVEGELLPTAWQHIFRLQPLRDRLVLGGVFALGTLCAGPILAGLLQAVPALFWALAGLAATGGAAAVACIIARSVVRHIKASGDTTITEEVIPWRTLQLGVGGAFAVMSLLIALLPSAPWQKAFWFTSLCALVACAWGFFFNEDLAVFVRKPHPLEAAPVPLEPGWKITAGLLVVAGFVAALAIDSGVAVPLLWFTLPIALVVIIFAALTAEIK